MMRDMSRGNQGVGGATVAWMTETFFPWEGLTQVTSRILGRVYIGTRGGGTKYLLVNSGCCRQAHLEFLQLVFYLVQH